jgi:hypothetical protein
LQAVGPVVPAVAAFRGWDFGRLAFKVGARQIVEQDVEGGAEQVAPFLGQVLLEGGLVRDDPVQAAVEPVLACHGRIGVEQEVHRGLREPLFVDVQFAARIEQPVDREQFEHLGPRHLAGFAGETFLPERAQAELLPGVTTRPAITETARLLDRESREFDLHHVVGRGRAAVAVGEESSLVTRAVLVQHVERVLPGVELCGVEFAKVQNLALDDSPAVYPQAFADRIISVALAVFVADAAFEEHRTRSIARLAASRLRGRSAHTRFPLFLRGSVQRKTVKIAFSCESRVKLAVQRGIPRCGSCC